MSDRHWSVFETTLIPGPKSCKPFVCGRTIQRTSSDGWYIKVAARVLKAALDASLTVALRMSDRYASSKVHTSCSTLDRLHEHF